MFKTNIYQFNDLCPLQVLKNTLHEKLFDFGVQGKNIDKIDSSDFTQLEIDFFTGCLIAHNDYDLDFILEDSEFLDIKKSIVKFMVEPSYILQADFLLLAKIKSICVNRHLNFIENMIQEIKGDVCVSLTEYFLVHHEAN